MELSGGTVNALAVLFYRNITRRRSYQIQSHLLNEFVWRGSAPWASVVINVCDSVWLAFSIMQLTATVLSSVTGCHL